MISDIGGLRQSSEDYRKYLLTFRLCSKIFGGLRVLFRNLRKSSEIFRSSSEGFRSSSEIFGSPRAIFGNLQSNFVPGKSKLTKNALCLNQSEFGNFALYVIRSIIKPSEHNFEHNAAGTDDAELGKHTAFISLSSTRFETTTTTNRIWGARI